MKPKIYTRFVIALIVSFSASLTQAQDANIKREAILTSKKWTCLDVNRDKLEKQAFKIEIGNVLSFRLDKKYSFQNNDYNFQAGTWKLDGKMLYFFYNAPDDNRILSARYKILKLTEDKLEVKKLEKPKGKLVFK